MLNPPLVFPEPSLRLKNAPPADRRLMILDTNIMQHAITSPSGAVIHRLNGELEKFHVADAVEMGFCMTPFQILEVLGIIPAEIGVVSTPKKGQSSIKIFEQLMSDAFASFSALSELSQERLAERARERRSYLPVEAHALFDMCISVPCTQPDLCAQISSVLAWDYAIKCVIPKRNVHDFNQLFASFMLVPGYSHLSRFRIAKRLWDQFYAKARHWVPDVAEPIHVANKAMQLKNRRDFLDCDIYHLACFGWFGADVTVFTCDPPESILNRISIYKGMFEAVAAIAPNVSDNSLPILKVGMIARCDPTGEITHIFPVQRIPTIV